MVGRICGQTRCLGGRTFGPGELSRRRSDGGGGLGAQIWGQTRCPMCRSGTFNVKRSTLNFQRGDRKGAWWPRYGDGHVIWTTGLLPRRTCRSAGRAVETGCGAEIWGQTRYPICRSGTFNAKRSTLNFQRGDRKGSSWAEYGDRLDVCHERLRGRQGAWNVTLRRSSIHKC